MIHLAARLGLGTDWDRITGPNIDAVLHVYLAAARHGVPRVIFASSVWAQYGYRHTRDALTPTLPPRPTNPYGIAKLFGERVGQCFFDQHGITGVAFRIGANRRGPVNQADHAMTRGDWEQACWVSDRDLCQGFERAVTAEYDRFAVAQPGLRQCRLALGLAADERAARLCAAGSARGARRREAARAIGDRAARAQHDPGIPGTHGQPGLVASSPDSRPR